jgi:hypothetical protein
MYIIELLEDFYSILGYSKKYGSYPVPVRYVIKDEFDHFEATLQIYSVPGCLSRIPDPDLQLSRISDPKTATKEKGEKKVFLIFGLLK